MDCGRVLRAARRARRINQRELAELAGVPRSTVDRTEAGRVAPRVQTFVRLLGAVGYGLAIVDDRGRLLEYDAEHDRLRDRAGRRFPAHLKAGPTPTCPVIDGPGWWGWFRIAWPFGPGDPPAWTYWQRPRKWGTGVWGFLDPSPDSVWDDAT